MPNKVFSRSKKAFRAPQNNPTREPKIHWQILVNIFYNLNGLPERCDGRRSKKFHMFHTHFWVSVSNWWIVFLISKNVFWSYCWTDGGFHNFLTHRGCGGRGLEEQFFWRHPYLIRWTINYHHLLNILACLVYYHHSQLLVIPVICLV